MEHSFDCYIYIDTLVSKAANLGMDGAYFELHNALIDSISHIDGVDEVCINHASWVRVDLGTPKTMGEALAIIDPIKAQIQKLFEAFPADVDKLRKEWAIRDEEEQREVDAYNKARGFE